MDTNINQDKVISSNNSGSTLTQEVLDDKTQVPQNKNSHTKLIYLLIGISGIFVLLTSLGGYFVYKTYFANSNSKIPTTAELKEKAAQKYLELRGVTFEEGNFLSQKVSTAPIGNTSNVSTDSINSTSLSQQNLIQNATKNIAQKVTSQKDASIYFTEVEVTATENASNTSIFPIAFGESKLIDYSKPFTLKTWTGPCSNKFVVIQNSKTLYFSNFTENSNTNYLGGKYAIKSTYTDSDQGYGCLNTPLLNSNPDLEFVQAILNDSGNFKQVGKEVINGITTIIYEQNYSTIIPMLDSTSISSSTSTKTQSANSKIRYYVDINKFQVLRTQYFDGSKLIYTANLISSKNLGTSGKSQAENMDELKGIEIKEVKVNLTNTFLNKETKLQDAIKLFSVLYLDKPLETVHYLYIYQDEQIDEYTKLSQTNDFDPSWSENQKAIDESYIPAFSSYSGNNYSVTVYKKQPTHNDTNTKFVSKDILIDGKKINANIIQFTYDTLKTGTDSKTALPVPSTAPDESTTVEFRYQNFWYLINFYTSENSISINPVKDQISLLNLTQAKALEIDSRNDFIKASQPKINYNSKLKDIPNTSRYLPGNLKPNYDFSAISLITDSAPNQKSACIQLTQSEMQGGIMQCLIDNYEGFQIVFSKELLLQPQVDSPNSSSSSGSTGSGVAAPDSIISYSPGYPNGSTNYYVFKAKYSELLPSLKQLFNYQNGENIDYKEINGHTIILESQTLLKTQRVSILEKVKIDNGLSDLESQLQSNKSSINNYSIGL